MDKVKLTKDQVQILELLNIQLFHNFWPLLIKASKNGLIRFDVNSDDFKYGYAKAIWDITLQTVAAAEGHLPTTKTLQTWSKNSDIKLEEYITKIGGKLNWENYKYTGEKEQQ